MGGGNGARSLCDCLDELFEVLAKARSLEELQRMEHVAREVRDRYMEQLGSTTAGELAIRRRVSRLNYSRRCAEASAGGHMQTQGTSSRSPQHGQQPVWACSGDRLGPVQVVP